jgi:hypothetical protein
VLTTTVTTYILQQILLHIQVNVTVIIEIMMKKTILNRARAIPTAEAPSVSREEIAPYSSRNSPTSDQLPFRILDETCKTFLKFNTTGCSLLTNFKSPGEEQEPAVYFEECITALTNYQVNKVTDTELVSQKDRNTVKVQDKVVGIGLRRRDQFKPHVVYSAVGKVIQSSVRFAD